MTATMKNEFGLISFDEEVLASIAGYAACGGEIATEVDNAV